MEKTMKKKCLYLAILLLFWAGQPVYLAAEKSLPDLKKEVIRIIERETTLLTETSDAIWEFAETALLEFKSSKLLADILEKKGFSLKREVADLPTAFIASYGSGKPVIGILAEYDALPGLSQDNTSFQKALVEGGSGHGCGHNLFGAGSLGAALAIKEVMESHKIKGTIRLYGCPAEEDVGGKLFMAREGLFDDLDACIAWHPDYTTKVDVKGSQAIDDIEIEFFGKTAHAAFDPWKGRSALDAVEMTTFGINLLREHVKPSVRIHYVITEGGDIPNVVPEHAKLWVWVRDSTRKGVKDVTSRVEEIARGAGLATRTTPKINLRGSLHEMLINRSGAEAMQKNLKEIGPITYTEEELAFAREIQKKTEVEEKGMVCEIKELEKPTKVPEGGSTDVAEVSWITPTVQILTSCAPFEVPWHSWAVVTSSKHPIGHKGMLLATKVMAATALDFLLEKEMLQKMQKEFKEKLGDYTYKSGLQPGQKPSAPSSASW
jgi:aminobenzoyl-glutamate utilization protein B